MTAKTSRKSPMFKTALNPRCLIGISALSLVLITACQPNPNSNDNAQIETTAVEPTQNEAAPLPSADEVDDAANSLDLADDEVDIFDDSLESKTDSSDVSSQESRIKDFNKVLGKMNDEMQIGQRYLDPDVAFAKIMLGYHRGVRDLAKIERKYGQDATMTTFAEGLIDAQKEDIGRIKKWLASHPDSTKPKADTPAMQAEFAREIDTLSQTMSAAFTDDSADISFAQVMLPHYLAAVNLANIELKYGRDDEMQQVARDFITYRQPVITLLDSWVRLQPSTDAAANTSGADTLDNAKDENANNAENADKKPATK